MSHATYLVCDNQPNCRKPPVRHNEGDEAPAGWRLGVQLPFRRLYHEAPEVVDACSQGCLKWMMDSVINAEWEKDDRIGIPDSDLLADSTDEESPSAFPIRATSTN